MVAAGEAWGWRAAVIVAGAAGLVGLAIVVAGSGEFRDDRDARREKAVERVGFRDSLAILMSAPIVLCFAFFLLIAMAQSGLQNFSPTILTQSFDFTPVLANVAVTALMIAVPLGIIAGGFLADATERHDACVAAAFALAAVATLGAGFVDVQAEGRIAFYFVAGLLVGTAYPSRDKLVRSLTPTGSVGKVFGFVYSGLDLGAAATPILFGWMVDNGMPLGMFVVVAALWMASVGVVLAAGRVTRAARASPVQ